MTWLDLRAAADRVREIPLEHVLLRSGAKRDGTDPARWHTERGPLSITGAKFMNWRQGVGGGGAIDLVMHLHGLGFRAAVVWLMDSVSSAAAPWRSPPPVRHEFRIPPQDPDQFFRVTHYLVGKRGLPVHQIQALVAAGSLHADARGNAMFLLRDARRQPVGAELRGTTSRRWRGMAPGSRKDRGFFAVPAPGARDAILCESAIDAISAASLMPGTLCISTSGARANPEWLATIIASGLHVACAFDTDAAGETMAHALISRFPTVQRLRPAGHDWNDALRANR